MESSRLTASKREVVSGCQVFSYELVDLQVRPAGCGTHTILPFTFRSQFATTLLFPMFSFLLVLFLSLTLGYMWSYRSV